MMDKIASAKECISGRIYSFDVISHPGVRALILGSMPGVASLKAHEYYAHPRNSFWPMIESVLHIPASLSYEQRIAQLLCTPFALWDVMRSCVREKSLDSAIQEPSIIPNDFNAFFEKHPAIQHILFNGLKAEATFRRYVMPTLTHIPFSYYRLPSTSPANASISMEKKQKAWADVLRGIMGEGV
jgi:double-stranded uracil-DNA glycosylase